MYNAPAPDEHRKISALLESYAISVTRGDADRFESNLLDLGIPFAGIWSDVASPASLAQVQDYAGFRKAIFESGKKFKQRFSNIKVEQLGSVAQVSLDYQTALEGADFDRKGWKVMHLLKVDGEWKIASEFFTGYPPDSRTR